jgi:hypothetical protein
VVGIATTDEAEKPLLKGTTSTTSVIVSVRFFFFYRIEIIGIIVEKRALKRRKKVARVLDY